MALFWSVSCLVAGCLKLPWSTAEMGLLLLALASSFEKDFCGGRLAPGVVLVHCERTDITCSGRVC